MEQPNAEDDVPEKQLPVGPGLSGLRELDEGQKDVGSSHLKFIEIEPMLCEDLEEVMTGKLEGAGDGQGRKRMCRALREPKYGVYNDKENRIQADLAALLQDHEKKLHDAKAREEDDKQKIEAILDREAGLSKQLVSLSKKIEEMQGHSQGVGASVQSAMRVGGKVEKFVEDFDFCTDKDVVMETQDMQW